MKPATIGRSALTLALLLVTSVSHAQQQFAADPKPFSGHPAATPAVATGVTTTGGTTGYIPKFTGASSVANSLIFDTGTTVGIGVGTTPNSAVKLDVGGGMIIRGNTIVARVGNATASKGYPSWGFEFYSNVYNSSTKAGDNPFFTLQSEPTSNNSASPSPPSICCFQTMELLRRRRASTSIPTERFTSHPRRHFPLPQDHKDQRGLPDQPGLRGRRGRRARLRCLTQDLVMEVSVLRFP